VDNKIDKLAIASLLFGNEAALHFQEGQQVLVDLVLVRGAEAVRGALLDLQGVCLP